MPSHPDIREERNGDREERTVEERPSPLTPLQEIERANGDRWASLEGDLDPPTYFPPQAVN
ncbi:MAG TPA: hypothetical protein VF405_03760 [Gammaproteobacteria bacterium]